MHIFQFNSMLVWTVFKIIMIFSPNFNDLLWVTAVIFKIGIKISARPPKCPRSPWREWGQCFRNKMHFTLVVSLPACREELLSKLKEYKTFCVIAGMLCVIGQLFVSQKETVKSVCTPGVESLEWWQTGLWVWGTPRNEASFVLRPESETVTGKWTGFKLQVKWLLTCLGFMGFFIII